MNNTPTLTGRPAKTDATGPPDHKPGSSTIFQLQYLRALAAVSVVLCHASFYVREYRGDGRMWPIFGRGGNFGVVLFFAISGYLMARLAQNAPGTLFMTHRLIRIYPIYWLCILGVVAINLLFGSTVRPNPLALLLIPGGTTSYVLGVEWTLPFELTFYFLVFLIIILRFQRFIPFIAAIWVLAIEVVYALKPEFQEGQFPHFLHLPLSQYSLPFAAGLLVPFAIKRNCVGPATLIIAIGTLLASESMSRLSLSFGLTSLGCALLVAVAARPREAGSSRPNRTLAALGDWSYALYLCHVPIIVALCKQMPPTIPSMQVWFAAVGLPLIAAIVVGKIDLAVYRQLKKWVDRSNKWITGTLCIVFLVILFFVGLRPYVFNILNRKTFATADSIAKQILSLNNTKHLSLATAAQSIGFRPDPELLSYSDGLYDKGGIRINARGWAADVIGRDRGITILLFFCGHYLGCVIPREKRPDVASVLRTGNDRYGFNESFPIPGGCDSGAIEELIVTEDNCYKIMSGDIQR
jgi:exopolysaccharide production protein ExoZ